jgi:hypothetical protein
LATVQLKLKYFVIFEPINWKGERNPTLLFKIQTQAHRRHENDKNGKIYYKREIIYFPNSPHLTDHDVNLLQIQIYCCKANNSIDTTLCSDKLFCLIFC